jgi:hypothetical protein
MNAGPLGAALMGLVTFLALYGPAALDPTRIRWLLRDDFSQHLLGWFFFRNTPLGLPLGAIPGYVHPLGTTLGYTDSIPWAGLLLRPLSGLLPADFQYIGPWLCLCLMLQGAVAAWVARRLGATTALQWLTGALLVLSPALLARMEMEHEALCAHWALVLLVGLNLLPQRDARDAEAYRSGPTSSPSSTWEAPASESSETGPAAIPLDVQEDDPSDVEEIHAHGSFPGRDERERRARVERIRRQNRRKCPTSCDHNELQAGSEQGSRREAALQRDFDGIPSRDRCKELPHIFAPEACGQLGDAVLVMVSSNHGAIRDRRDLFVGVLHSDRPGVDFIGPEGALGRLDVEASARARRAHERDRARGSDQRRFCGQPRRDRGNRVVGVVTLGIAGVDHRERDMVGAHGRVRVAHDCSRAELRVPEGPDVPKRLAVGI